MLKLISGQTPGGTFNRRPTLRGTDAGFARYQPILYGQGRGLTHRWSLLFDTIIAPKGSQHIRRGLRVCPQPGAATVRHESGSGRIFNIDPPAGILAKVLYESDDSLWHVMPPKHRKM
jgi:hypothetical protein